MVNDDAGWVDVGTSRPHPVQEADDYRGEKAGCWALLRFVVPFNLKILRNQRFGRSVKPRQASSHHKVFKEALEPNPSVFCMGKICLIAPSKFLDYQGSLSENTSQSL
jgi:hypothetical protein